MPMKHTIILFFIVSCSSNFYCQTSKYESNFEKFRQYYTLLRHHYVDTVNFDKIIESAIVKSLENLDPHSMYLPPKEASSENEKLKGSFEGIGIVYNVYKDTLQILDVVAGGPSEKVGLMIGDKLIKIGDTTFAGDSKYKSDDYVSRLKGPRGTKVAISVLRGDKLIDFIITRDVIPIYSVDIATMIDNETGYIKLNKFAGSTPQEISAALNDLSNKGMKTLILDLQNNGGGLLQAAVALCDEFLESKRLVVYTQGEHYPKQSFETSENGLFRKGKLIILINENSASASEIVSGAIQDWDRGLIIGRRSFGKGLVQRPFTLLDNSQLRLTTAEYFTPSGRFIQKPFNKGIKEYRAEIIQRAQSGQLTKKDTLVPPDSLMKYTNNKRKVYGGGGITPDIYVPIDTSINSEYYFNFLRKGLVNQYTTDFIDKNKKSILEKYPKIEDFYMQFQLDSAQFNEFLVLGDSAKIKRDTQAIEKSGAMIKTILKANIGRGIYGTMAFYKIIMDIDPVIQKAIAIRRENFSKYKVRNE